MSRWVLTGLRTRVVTTSYPRRADPSPGTGPGRPRATRMAPAAAEALAAACPSGALAAGEAGVAVDARRCVHCMRCRDAGIAWSEDCEWAGLGAAARSLERAFGRSLHLRFVDAGACGACVAEARHLNSPYYNMHRLGLFVTPTPRKADVLLVAGPVSDAMRAPLIGCYEAMPEPRRVVAMGACALSGGVFGPSFAAAGGVAEVLPVDVEVPGCPPPPLALLHALLVVVRRKPPAALGEQPGEPRPEGRR